MSLRDRYNISRQILREREREQERERIDAIEIERAANRERERNAESHRRHREVSQQTLQQNAVAEQARIADEQRRAVDAERQRRRREAQRNIGQREQAARVAVHQRRASTGTRVQRHRQVTQEALSAEEHEAAAARRRAEITANRRQQRLSDEVRRREAEARAAANRAVADHGALQRIDEERERLRIVRLNPASRARRNAQQNARRRLLQDDFTNYIRARMGDLEYEQEEPPTADQLLFGERNALAALHLYHHRTGHQFVDPARRYCELSDEAHQWLDVRVAESVDAVLAELDVIYDQYMMNPPVLHEVLTLDDVVTIQDVLKLLRSFEQSSDRHSEVIDYIRNRLDPDQPMPACACCGEIYASAMDRPVSGEQVSGCERHVAELSILRLRPDEVNAYFAVEEQHRPCLSVYRAVVENEVVYYHLHPQFVNGDGVATLCMRCCHDIETHHRKPEFSLANGFDYGDIERLPGRASIHRPLTIAEQMAISKARPYCVMIKQYLERGAAHRFKLASHMITMPFGGPDVIDDLPRTAQQIQETLKIVFVGAATFTQVRSALLIGLRNAHVNRDVVNARLDLYSAVNSRYASLRRTPEASYAVLSQLPRVLQNTANATDPVPENIAEGVTMVINQPAVARLDELASSLEGRDIAHVRDDLEEEEENEYIVRRGIDGSEAPATVTQEEGEGEGDGRGFEEEKGERYADIVLPVPPTAASLLISHDGSTAADRSVGNIISRELRAIQEVVRGTGQQGTAAGGTDATAHPRTAGDARDGVTTVPVGIRRGDQIPYNEYTQNRDIYLDSFPELFLLGRGIPDGGPLSPRFVQHLNRQYTGKFAKHLEFQCLVFNQNQRQAAARAVAKKVRNQPIAMERAASMLNSPEFSTRLHAAMADPTSDDAKQIVSEVSPILQGLGKHVPHSHAARAEVVTEMYAILQRHGLGSIFATFAPDDTNDIIMLRFCYATVRNDLFPAVSRIYEAGAKTFKELLDDASDIDPATIVQLKIPLRQTQKVVMASQNPVSVARLYLFMQHVLFRELLGLEIHTSRVLKTLPRVDDSVTFNSVPDGALEPAQRVLRDTFRGMYPANKFTGTQPPLGQGLAGLAVTEEQKKQTLHTHALFMTTLKPELLQCVAGHRYLETLACRIIDNVVKTELPPEIHFKYAVCNEIGGLPKKRMSRELPPAIDGGNDDALNTFAHEAAGTTNIHAHEKPGACVPKKQAPDGREKCRFGKGTVLNGGTTTIQLYDDGDGGTLVGSVEERDPQLLVRNREAASSVSFNRGLQPDDGRAVMFIGSRRAIGYGDTEPNDFNFHDDLLNSVDLPEWKNAIIRDLNAADRACFRLSDVDTAAIQSLTVDQALLVREVIQNRNRMVVDYNIISTAALRCNTALYMLGCAGQCIAVFMYLVKYISKDADYLANSLALIAKAKQYISTYPAATREDGESDDIRHLKRFCQRILNNAEGGTREMATTTIAYANIGGSGHITSDAFKYVHAYDMTREALRLFSGTEPDTGDADVNYGSLPIYTLRDGTKVAVSQAQIYLDRVHEELSGRSNEILEQCQDRVRALALSLPFANDDREQINASTELAFAKALVNNTLEHLNLREFCALVQLETVERNEWEALYVEMREQSNWGFNAARTHGRKPSMRFLLRSTNPLYETHCLTLRTKHFVPIMSGGKAPAYPTTVVPNGEVGNVVLAKHRKAFAEYAIANYWPYTRDVGPMIQSGNAQIPITFDWEGFCLLCDYMYSRHAPFIARGRLFELESLAYGTREHPAHGALNKRLITSYRYDNADNLLDQSALDPFGVRGRRRTAAATAGQVTNESDFGEWVDEPADPDLDNQARQMAQEIYDRNRMSEPDAAAALNRMRERETFVRQFETTAGTLYGRLRGSVASNDEIPTGGIGIGHFAHVHGINEIPDLTRILDNISTQDAQIVRERGDQRHVPGAAPNINADVPQNHPQGCDLTDPLERPENAELSAETISDIRRELGFGPNDHMDYDQYLIVATFRRRFQGTDNHALLCFVQGGPGTGKTFTVDNSSRLTNRPFVFCAIGGSNASNLPGGSTVCNVFGFNPMRKGCRPSQRDKMTPLGVDNQPTKLRQLREWFVIGQGILVMDEVSLCSALYFTHMSNRMKELRAEDDEARHQPFGGFDVCVAGDWNQISSIGSKSIPEVIFQRLTEMPQDLMLVPPAFKLMMEAADLFMGFRRFQLTVQNRARGDIAHTERIRSIVDYSQPQPISDNLIRYLNSIPLRQEDIRSPDSEWVTSSTCLTASNVERACMNDYQARLFARLRNEVCIIWALPSPSHRTEPWSDDELLSLHDNYPETNGYFVRGAPCALTVNTKPEKGLSNGAQGIMNSIVFDPSDRFYDDTLNKIHNAAPGECIFVRSVPSHMIVDMRQQPRFVFPENERLPEELASPVNPADTTGVPYVSVPIALVRNKVEVVKDVSVGDRMPINYSYYVSAVELLFACTFEKAQGKTMNKVIMCLHPNPWRSLTLPHFYVAFTRVTDGNNLRVWPAPNLRLERFRTLACIICVGCGWRGDRGGGRGGSNVRDPRSSAANVVTPATDRVYGRGEDRGRDSDSARVQNLGGGRGRGRGRGRDRDRVGSTRPAIGTEGPLVAGNVSAARMAEFAREQTQSWAYMPFLREVFAAVVPGPRMPIAAIDVLREYWPDHGLSFEEEIVRMREAYRSVGLYEPIRYMYQMNVHSNTYIVANDQELLLGDFTHYPVQGRREHVFSHLAYLRSINDGHYETIAFVGALVTAAIHNMRLAVGVNVVMPRFGVASVSSATARATASASETARPSEDGSFMSPMSVTTTTVGDISATVISHSPPARSSGDSMPYGYRRLAPPFSPNALRRTESSAVQLDELPVRRRLSPPQEDEEGEDEEKDF